MIVYEYAGYFPISSESSVTVDSILAYRQRQVGGVEYTIERQCEVERIGHARQQHLLDLRRISLGQCLIPIIFVTYRQVHIKRNHGRSVYRKHHNRRTDSWNGNCLRCRIICESGEGLSRGKRFIRHRPPGSTANV